MRKPLHRSGHYNQDFSPKPPISQRNFSACSRPSIYRVFQQDALNTKVTQENVSNYFECVTKASGSGTLPISSQSLGCYFDFSLPTQFAQQTSDVALQSLTLGLINLILI